MSDTKAQLIDVEALRAGMLDLLGRCNTALEFKPDAATAGEYAAQLEALAHEIGEASYLLAHARVAVNLAELTMQQIVKRHDAVNEVFAVGSDVDYEFTFLVAVDSLWGEMQPTFPALHMDFAALTPAEDVPF